MSSQQCCFVWYVSVQSLNEWIHFNFSWIKKKIIPKLVLLLCQDIYGKHTQTNTFPPKLKIILAAILEYKWNWIFLCIITIMFQSFVFLCATFYILPSPHTHNNKWKPVWIRDPKSSNLNKISKKNKNKKNKVPDYKWIEMWR